MDEFYICKGCGETVNAGQAYSLEYLCPTCGGYLLPESEYEGFQPDVNDKNMEYGISRNKISQLGDNYPNYDSIHLRLELNRNRKDLVCKLINEDLGTITKDDILDFKIDIEIYNKNCRKQKIKKQYNKRKKNV